MTSTTGIIHSLTSDKNGNVYAGSANGIVYKLTASSTLFTLMTGTTGDTLSLTSDKDGNVYAGSQNGIIYKS